MADIVSATDLIIKAFTTVWAAGSPSIVGGAAPAIVTEAIEQSLKPHPSDGNAPWVRITVRHATGQSAALGNHKFAKTGTVFVQIFVPFKDGSAYSVAQALAKLAASAYEGERAGGVTFPAVATPERGRDGTFYRCDCIAEFVYHETK